MDTSNILLKVTTIHPDRTQYKQFDVHFEGVPHTDLLVQVPIDKAHVISKEGFETIITLDGLAQVCGEIQDAWDSEYKKYLNKMKGVK
jgi:hypothetical protein